MENVNNEVQNQEVVETKNNEEVKEMTEFKRTKSAALDILGLSELEKFKNLDKLQEDFNALGIKDNMINEKLVGEIEDVVVKELETKANEKIDAKLKEMKKEEVEKIDGGRFVERYNKLTTKQIEVKETKQEPEKEIKVTFTQRIINFLKAIWNFICHPIKTIKSRFSNKKEETNVKDQE